MAISKHEVDSQKYCHAKKTVQDEADQVKTRASRKSSVVLFEHEAYGCKHISHI